MKTVAVVDCGTGNIGSVLRAAERCDAHVIHATRPDLLADATHVILPGVGSFADGMRRLREAGFEVALRDIVSAGRPLLGICLGMQLLAEHGDEGGETEGLGFIRGSVTAITPLEDERVPHVGWNEVRVVAGHALLDGVPDGADMYFSHGYALRDADAADIVAVTPYADGFPSVVAKGNVFGIQFHAEKSHAHGLRILQNFLSSPC